MCVPSSSPPPSHSFVLFAASKICRRGRSVRCGIGNQRTGGADGVILGGRRRYVGHDNDADDAAGVVGSSLLRPTDFAAMATVATTKRSNSVPSLPAHPPPLPAALLTYTRTPPSPFPRFLLFLHGQLGPPCGPLHARLAEPGPRRGRREEPKGRRADAGAFGQARAVRRELGRFIRRGG